MKERWREESGPVAWAVIIAATLGLLLFLRGSLWLVVPALLALLLYHALRPVMQMLVFRGMAREHAAAVVMLAFLAVAAVLVAVLGPRVTSQAINWQASVDRYIQGGMQLLYGGLRALESGFVPLARANLADAVASRLQQAGSLAEHIEPLVVGLATYLPSMLLAPFLSYFFLRDGHRFKGSLCRAVPNAFFERSLALLHEVDKIAGSYFLGLLKLTVLDALTLAVGLWALGFSGALALGLICAVLAWIPYVGSILGGLAVVMVAATDFPNTPAMAYWAAGLFLVVRLLDDFLYMPMTVGRDLHMHPLVTVVMIFAGGAVAGIAGLMLVLPVFGVVRVIGETVAVVASDPRLMARFRHARRLRRRAAARDLVSGQSPSAPGAGVSAASAGATNDHRST
jgi:predicted PurR-regulated permease PerM